MEELELNYPHATTKYDDHGQKADTKNTKFFTSRTILLQKIATERAYFPSKSLRQIEKSIIMLLNKIWDTKHEGSAIYWSALNAQGSTGR